MNDKSGEVMLLERDDVRRTGVTNVTIRAAMNATCYGQDDGIRLSLSLSLRLFLHRSKSPRVARAAHVVAAVSAPRLAARVVDEAAAARAALSKVLVTHAWRPPDWLRSAQRVSTRDSDCDAPAAEVRRAIVESREFSR